MWRRSTHRPANLLLAMIVLATIVLPFTSVRAQACGTQRGFWTTIPGPRFDKGPATISGLDIDAQSPNRMLVTNGALIMRSTDRGCSWKKVLDVTSGAELPGRISGDATVKTLASSERDGDLVFASVEERVGPVSRPHVVVSDDGGADWSYSDAGLPLAGVPKLLEASASDPGAAYLVIDVAGASDLLVATTNAGAAWQAKNRLPAAAVDLAIDPSASDTLWLGATDGLYRSKNGGSSFTAIDQFATQPTGPVDVFHHEGSPARILAFNAASGSGRVSNNGGQTWPSVGNQGPVTSVAHGLLPHEIAKSAAGRVWGFVPSILDWVDLRAPTPNVRGLVFDRTRDPSMYGYSPRTIEIFGWPPLGKIDIPKGTVEIPDISLIETDPPDLGDTRLTPAKRKVKLDVGESKTVPYKLKVPRTLTPLDVLFLVDTSSSMTQVIREAAEALGTIYNGLAASGAAVQFGLVEFRSYPTDVPPRSDTDNYVYRRVLNIGAGATEMTEAIRGLTAEGGGQYDAQLEALWQTATGSGKDVWPTGPSSRDVPAGQQVDFRLKALRVVIHVGDEPFGREGAQRDQDNNVTRPENELAKPDIPEFDAVAQALRSNNIKQLGLSLYPDATEDLREMAAATDALAPREGVDCDRDGIVEIEAGEPLVCVLRPDEIEDVNMTPAIISLVEAVRTKSSVRLDTSGKNDEVVQAIKPDRYTSVLLQADNTMNFDVVYTCPRSLEGETLEIELRARGIIGEQPVARASVVCAPIKAKDEPPAIPFRLEQVLSAAPLIPFGPPPPITEVASSTQTQAQAQANAAMAAQEQEQPQVALVHALHRAVMEAQQEEYAFSSLRKEPTLPPGLVPLGGAALLMSMTFGVASTLRTRTRLRLRYNRR
jgi:hypothetical protein